MPKLIRRSAARILLATVASLAVSPMAALAQDKPQIIAVNDALRSMAERLVGDDADVIYPVPAGTDPSFWRPGIADISRMQGADMVILNGAGFSTWTTKASLPRSRLVDTSRAFEDRFITTETVTHSHGDGGEHSHAATAAYTWLDPELAGLQARAIAGALVQRGLIEEATLQTRLEALDSDLEAVDTAVAELGALADGRVLIATHPRYQYFARAAGLDIRSLQWDAGAEPTPDQLAELRSLVEETGATVLVWEADPGDEARQAVRQIGLVDTIFPTMAVPDGDNPADYRTRMQTAVDGLRDALNAANG